ncbi:MAG: hypothetical protein MI924_28695 [Chloroflexales bacterium]|nr:hypothetical protein [Chloroflexales bacterium]
MSNASASLFLVVLDRAHEPVFDAVERAMHSDGNTLTELPVVTQMALSDPYLAQQIVQLHRHWEIQPRPVRGWLARIRTRLAWWLMGPELRHANTVNATLVRVIDSLIVHLDAESVARRHIEEYLVSSREQT